MLEELCQLLLRYAGKRDPLNSRSYLPPSFSLRKVPCHQAPRSMVFPNIHLSRSFHSLVPSSDPVVLYGFGEITLYRNKNVRRTKSLVLLLKNDVEVLRPAEILQPRILSQRPKTNPPRSNARRPSRNGQACRRPVQPPRSNTRACLGFVSMIFLKQGGASWLKFVWPALILVSQMIQERGSRRKVALIVVAAMPMGSKLPASDVSIRTSTCGRCSFDASVLLLTRASPVHFSGAKKRGSAIMPKVVKLVRPSSTLAEELSPCFAQSAAVPSVRLRVFLSIFTSASLARRGY